MNASSVGSTTQPSVSAHQSARSCGADASTAIWKSKGIAGVSLRSVEVTQECDFRPVVDRLPVDMQHELGHRVLRVRALRRPAGHEQAVSAEAAHALDPRGVDAVELHQRIICGSGIAEALPIACRAAEMPGVPRSEY